MASFSFGAGNARKLAALPLYALGRLATAVIPRSRDAWVFGCATGIGDGALALWRIATDDGRPAVWLTGSPRDAADAAAAGIPSLPKASLRGFWRTARARVVVVTHGFGDANRYALDGAFVVQLWHGIPLKRIGLDSAETLRVPGVLAGIGLDRPVRRALAEMFRGAARRIRVLPAASHLVRGRLESAFALDDSRVPVTGEPRVDVLSRGSAATRRAEARARISALTGTLTPSTRTVLYAPTWRDGGEDPAVPSADDWRALVTMLEARDAVLLVRSHPLGAGDYTPPRPTERVRALGSDVVPDVTPLLPGIDVLVTDYSSLVFDAALVPTPTVHLAPDVEAYARTRGFYGRYDEVAADVVTTWRDATVLLDAVLADPETHAGVVTRAEALSARVHAHRDGRNAERVYRAIQTGLARDATKGRR